jgi:hypothetical protein
MENLAEESILIFDAITQDAKLLFDKLESDLQPKCFIVSIIQGESQKKPFAFLQYERDSVTWKPEIYGLSEDFFSRIKSIEKEFEKNNIDSLKNLYEVYPDFNQKYKPVIKNIAYQEAIEIALNSEKINNENISFCSYPVLVNGYLTYIVIQLNRSAFDCFYKLKKVSLPKKHYGVSSFTKETSLLRSVVIRFLRKSSNYFNNQEIFYRNIGPIFFHNPGNEIEMDAIIISAGQYLLLSIAKSVISVSSVSLLNRKDLFYTFNEISSLRYEGSEGIGKISISQRHHPNINEIVTFTKPIKLDDFGAVRKMLQIASDTMFLISDSNYLFGIGELTGVYKEENEDLFFINFVKHYTWELTHAGAELMLVSYGQPGLPKIQGNKQYFGRLMSKIFNRIKKENIHQLWSLISRAIHQKHGTMVVITNEALEEANRLKSQAIMINPINITLEMVDKMTEIDGAIFINPTDLKCYAIGAILDGMATDKGNPARGSRYNSAVRYCEHRHGKCLIIVISEDGVIDLVY